MKPFCVSRHTVITGAILLLHVSIAHAQPAPGAKLNFESAVLNAADNDLSEAGWKYHGVEKPALDRADCPADTVRTWRSSSVHFGDQPGVSLAYETLPVSPSSVTEECGSYATQTQKVMHELLPLENPGYQGRRDSESFVALGEMRYVGFAFRIAQDPAHSEVPSAPAMVFQLWQGTPFSPIVAASIVGSGTGEGLALKFEVRSREVRDGAPIPICVSDGSDGVEAGRVSVERGHWYKFIVKVIPSLDPDEAELRVWSEDAGFCASGCACESAQWWGNDYQRVITLYNTPIGYSESEDAFCHTAGTEDPKYPLPGGLFEIGLYRPFQDTRMKVFFDQVRITTTFEAAKLESW